MIVDAFRLGIAAVVAVAVLGVLLAATGNIVTIHVDRKITSLLAQGVEQTRIVGEGVLRKGTQITIPPGACFSEDTKTNPCIDVNGRTAKYVCDSLSKYTLIASCQKGACGVGSGFGCRVKVEVEGRGIETNQGETNQRSSREETEEETNTMSKKSAKELTQEKKEGTQELSTTLKAYIRPESEGDTTCLDAYLLECKGAPKGTKLYLDGTFMTFCESRCQLWVRLAPGEHVLRCVAPDSTVTEATYTVKEYKGCRIVKRTDGSVLVQACIKASSASIVVDGNGYGPGNYDNGYKPVRLYWKHEGTGIWSIIGLPRISGYAGILCEWPWTRGFKYVFYASKGQLSDVRCEVKNNTLFVFANAGTTYEEARRMACTGLRFMTVQPKIRREENEYYILRILDPCGDSSDLLNILRFVALFVEENRVFFKWGNDVVDEALRFKGKPGDKVKGIVGLTTGELCSPIIFYNVFEGVLTEEGFALSGPIKVIYFNGGYCHPNRPYQGLVERIKKVCKVASEFTNNEFSWEFGDWCADPLAGLDPYKKIYLLALQGIERTKVVGEGVLRKGTQITIPPGACFSEDTKTNPCIDVNGRTAKYVCDSLSKYTLIASCQKGACGVGSGFGCRVKVEIED